MIVISSNLIAAIAKWTSTDGMRPALQQVLFTSKECVACDGVRLVRVPIGSRGPAFGVDREYLLAAIAAHRDLKPTLRDLTLSLVDKRVEIRIGDRVTMNVPAADASSFPPYDQVMPKERPETAPDGYAFDPRYLAAIHEVEQAAGARNGSNGLKITGWSADGLGAMLFEGFEGIRYVVMPVKL